MAYSSGHAKQGGRQKGTRNKATVAKSRALQRSAQITADQALENLSTIANSQPERGFSGADTIKANELILRVKGALADARPESRVTVNIGFLTNANAQPPMIQVMPDSHQVLSPQPQVLISGD